MRTTAELREGYLSFFEARGHLRYPSYPLVPRAGDDSTLLVSAGMQPQMPFFLGLEPPPAPLTTLSQKVFRTVDRVNQQLDKMDQVTDSAVDMADSADTAVRAVSTAITTPVKKVSGLAAGITHGFSAFRSRHDAGEAVRVAKDAAARRESELDEELRNAAQAAPADPPPAA